ncbi:UNVERIFIED_CONTAM: LOB domain-containing protein 29 [Sesamum latifolium]|uniref:LOB domain-containing protein 29 n=1 Tax=Sesamum latifolium TaxID=2727402 RepID=A0AAW2XXB5_9LAMI
MVKGGDRNTRFFHQKASHRFRSNLITKLRTSNRALVDKEEEIQHCILSHFEDVYSSSHPRPDDVAHGTAQLRRVVDEDMEDELSQPYHENEVTKALFEMAPLKSLGPDGMSPIFYQKFWHIVKYDVIPCTLRLLNSHDMPHTLNDTQIVLIPKCKNPDMLSQFHPISLCNVIYKIASKTVANRLKRILDRIISPAQSAFVPGRLIIDNILLAFEVNHFLNTKTIGKKGFMAMKLDVSKAYNKAYDKVEWVFLEQVLSKLGFSRPFIHLVMLFVSSVSYSFMLGGKQFASIIPQRGLRQGDPLSPYLFLLCTEAFSSMLDHAVSCHQLLGISACRGAPHISHLLFVDDTLIFSQGTVEHSRIIKVILETYRKASGQEINFHKSSVAFSKNSSTASRQDVVREMNIRMENKMELYLGLPSRTARSKRELFSAICDRIWNRLNGWNEKILSQAGKEVLIKSIIQAIPAYAMGCFKLPVTFLRELHSMTANFWWNNRGKSKIHWISWQKLCNSKLMVDWVFGSYISSISLCSRSDFGEFIATRIDYYPKYFEPDTSQGVMSSQPPLADAHHTLGGVSLLRTIFSWQGAAGVLAQVNLYVPGKMRVCLDLLGCEDRIIWHFTKNGLFSVKSAYHLAQSLDDLPSPSSLRQTEQRWWSFLWQAKIPSKVKVFIWRICTDALPTAANLNRRIASTSFSCPFCNDDMEDIPHMLFHCPFARQVWSLSNIGWHSLSMHTHDAFQWMMSLLSNLMTDDLYRALIICWCIWWSRNSKLMKEKFLSPDQIICFAAKYLESFSNQNLDMGLSPLAPTQDRWKCPPASTIKVNCDGAIFEHRKEIGLGVIARNEFGICIAWSAKSVPKETDSEHVEAEARHALELATRFGWDSIILESDCANLITKLNLLHPDLSYVGPIVADIIQLASTFRSCKFSFVKSYEQAAAHFAAIHRVFGASNVAKLLAHLPISDRCQAAVTVSYEAQARLQDPIYGCVSHIFVLQQQVVNLQAQLAALKEQAAAHELFIMNSSSSAGNPNHHKPYGESPSNYYCFPQDTVYNWCQDHVEMSQLDTSLNNDNIGSMLHSDSRRIMSPNPNSVKYGNLGLIPEENTDSPHDMQLNDRHWPFDQDEDEDHDLQSSDIFSIHKGKLIKLGFDPDR